MTEEERQKAQPTIEAARKLQHKVIAELTEGGADAKETLIGSLYGTLDMATVVTGDRLAGIKWLQQALKKLERAHRRAEIRPPGGGR